MKQEEVRVLTGDQVRAALAGRENEIMDIVAEAYRLHERGESNLPHSIFLRFPGRKRERIIGLPAYLGGGVERAGFKWIASFPENVHQGIDRASAVMILNSVETGRPEAFLEGSIISAKRTAASAALAARVLRAGRPISPAGFIGCGIINFEIARFLHSLEAAPETFVLFDITPGRAEIFRDWCEKALPGVRVEVAASLEALLQRCPVVSFATTAVEPHVTDLSSCAPGSTILHISLRDVVPAVVLQCDNVVDDLDHVCRAQTSIHLTAEEAGNRDFVRCSLGAILLDQAPAVHDVEQLTLFSPFGLGILDLALADYVMKRAAETEAGTVVDGFLPGSVVEFGRST